MPEKISLAKRFFYGPFPWARAIGIPVAVIVLVFLDAGGLTLFVLGLIGGAAGAYRLVQGIWAVTTHPSREYRAVGVRRAISGALTIAGLFAAFSVFDESFDRAEETGLQLAGRVQAACKLGARCPEDLSKTGWDKATAGWVYQFPLEYFLHESDREFSLWVRAGIDEGTMFLGGADRELRRCSRLEFEIDACK